MNNLKCYENEEPGGRSSQVEERASNVFEFDAL